MSETYVFDQAWSDERARLAGIEAMWDPGSKRLIGELGIGAGSRILEVGAGGGALVEWMADVVGPGGHVVATDIDPRFLASISRPNVDVIRHDVVAEQLPDTGFDLVHSRLVLEHLPARAAVLDKLVSAVRPGGVLLIEDYDWGPHDLHPRSELMARIIDGVGRLMEARGYDRFYGRSLIGELRRRLVEVRSDGRLAMIDVASPGAAAFKLSLDQLREGLVSSGALTQDEVDAGLAMFDETERSIITPAMIAVWGQALDTAQPRVLP